MFQAIKKIIPSIYNEKSQRKTKSIPFSVRVNKLLNFLVKIVIVFILLFINSLIICYIVNKNFSPYPIVLKEIFFYYDDKNQNYIKTEVYVNCSKQKKERGMQCIELGPTKYSFIAHFDISNKIDTNDTKNYEIETVYTDGQGNYFYDSQRTQAMDSGTAQAIMKRNAEKQQNRTE